MNEAMCLEKGKEKNHKPVSIDFSLYLSGYNTTNVTEETFPFFLPLTPFLFANKIKLKIII